MGNGQKQDITSNLHSFTETGGFAFKLIQRDGQEFLDVLTVVETDHCDVDTLLLVLVQSVDNEQLLVAEGNSLSVALLGELYRLEFAGNDLDMMILRKIFITKYYQILF